MFRQSKCQINFMTSPHKLAAVKELSHLFRDISIHELLELRKSKELTLVDVRSPSEYEEATIPGSVNIPFFDDEERKQVGTIYKQVSIGKAKEVGLEIASRKLPSLVRQFSELPGNIALFCWRGGMRSKATSSVLSLMGIKGYRLTGGVRAYRKWIVDELAHFQLEPECIVINGFTGSGKTKILQRLAEKGYPVIDLEAMAGHRGSIFGHIGLKPANQKRFDSLLVEQCLQWRNEPFVLIEAESSRLGKVILPDFLIFAKEHGRQIFVDMPREARAAHIIEDYQPHLYKDQCIQAFEHISKRIHTPIVAEIAQALNEDRFHQAVELLLQYYYDPRYTHATLKYSAEPLRCEANSLEEAVQMIEKQVDSWFSTIK